MALPREECTPDPSAAYEPVPIRGWGNDVEAVLRRLGSVPIKAPLFFLERIEKAHADLDSEVKLLEVARREVAAMEEQTVFLQNVLDQACAGDLEALIGYNSRIPALPPRPARRHITRQPQAARANPDRSGRKRKRSLSQHYLRVVQAGQHMAGRRLVTRRRAL